MEEMVKLLREEMQETMQKLGTEQRSKDLVDDNKVLKFESYEQENSQHPVTEITKQSKSQPNVSQAVSQSRPVSIPQT